MLFNHEKIFLTFNFLLLLIAIFIVICESQSLNVRKDEIILKLRPLKYNSSDGCKEFCENIICETIKKCANGTIVEKGSYCNCCDACVKYLDIGQPCKNMIVGSLALGVQSRCRPGTNCKNGKCELDGSIIGCLQQRENRLNLKGNGNYAKNIWIPQCDDEGKYKGKQKKIRKSICVDESGNRIFGSADDSPDNACACSRQMQKKEKNIIYFVKPQEHCSSSGNFDTLQCIGNLCYCADKDTGQVKSSLVKLGFLDKLPCYDSELHRKTYLKDCEVELQRSRKLSYDFYQKGVKLLGIDRIKCDPDGSFSPSQCLSDRCVCTDKEGVGIGSYYKEIGEVVKLNMTCNCARGESSTFLASAFTCLGYGSYNSFTCFNDVCVCVDEDGDGISVELKKSETDVELFCSELIENLNKPSDEDITLETKKPDDDNDDYDYYNLN